MRNFIPLKLSGGTKAVKYIVTMQFNRWSLLFIIIIIIIIIIICTQEECT